jgi:hypothetical protein
MKNDNIRILLKNEEQFYLRLYLLGMRDSGIQKFLNLDLPRLLQIKNQLISKFNTADISRILNKSIRSGLLNTHDYITNSVKQDALFYTDLIFENYFEGEESDASVEILKKNLFQFLKMDENKLRSNFVRSDD